MVKMAEEQVTFNNEYGEKLSGTLHWPGQETRRGVLLAHCFTCSRHTSILRQLGQDLAQAGIAALRYDFSGNGKSEGLFADTSYTKHVGEVEAAAALLDQKGVDQIALAGHSMGATISLLAAGRIINAHALCTLAGRLSRPDFTHFLSPSQRRELENSDRVEFESRGRRLTLNKDFFLDAARYDLTQTVAQLTVPLLVVHGDRDEIIPVAEARSLEAMAMPQVDVFVVQGADHMFSNPVHRRQVSGMVTQWLDRLWPSAPS
jgi:putative redox protein